ncbi:hypothetical protein SB00610_04517 [Klebsiella quasipneumoniae subsp. similipneumoniae]|nr:hypothetical protein SB00610_04517 [Klebsiella quasipneumoniae subsp. similipneumoniae]
MKIADQRGDHRLPLFAFINKATQIALLQKFDLAHHDLEAQAHLIVVRPFGPNRHARQTRLQSHIFRYHLRH